MSRKGFALFLFCLSCAAVLAARGANGAPEKPRKNEGVESVESRTNGESGEELRQRIGDLAWNVTQNAATEMAFSGEYDHFFEKGVYVDVVSGKPLFSSKDKFDSGCGWPAFSKSIAPEAVSLRGDSSHGMTRVEVRSAGADSHLGHVFEDGPAERGGKRFCINSAALRFIPFDEMEAAGLGRLKRELWPADTAAAEAAAHGKDVRVIYLAGGCFWGMQKFLDQFDGVVETEVGYANGNGVEPTYQQVSKANTGHAETVKVLYDEAKLPLRRLLERYFMAIDPFSRDRQGGDYGRQYRTGIYYTDPAQQEAIREVCAAVEEKEGKTLAVEVLSIDNFSRAEEFHQKYLDKNPGGYCHIPERLLKLK